MAIVHTFTKAKDQYILNVSQDTGYTLVYVSRNKTTTVKTGNLVTDETVILPVSIDGYYQLTLVADAETDVVIDFHVKYNLRNSIVIDALYLLCGDCDCYDSSNIANCISKVAKKCLKHKAIFVKLLTYQNTYIPIYATDYSNDFQAFITASLEDANCDVQKTINTILNEECITGSVKNVDNFFKLFFAIYWLGMYIIEQKEAPDQDELDYIDIAYKYEQISECICDLGLDVDELISNFPENDGSTVIHHWQFPDTVTDISFAPSIGLPYLSDKADVALADFLNGLIFSYNGVGRIAFALLNITENQYRIEDTFGEDVTSVVFDTYWNVGLNMQIYISKEYYAAPNIYYQLVEN